MRHGGDVHRAKLFCGANAQGVTTRIESHASLAHFFEHRAQVARLAMAKCYVAAGHRTGEGVGRRFDAVGDDPVFRAPQPAHTVNGDGRATRAGNFCAHRVEKRGQVGDLRLAGGALDDRGAVGQGGRHHHVGRAKNRRAAPPAKETLPAGQPLGAGVDVPGLDPHAGAKVAHALEMQVDRAGTDDAAARHRDLGLVQPPHKGAEDAD